MEWLLPLIVEEPVISAVFSGGCRFNQIIDIITWFEEWEPYLSEAPNEGVLTLFSKLDNPSSILAIKFCIIDKNRFSKSPLLASMSTDKTSPI